MVWCGVSVVVLVVVVVVANHLSVHQWIRSAIRDSQQPVSPIRFLFLKLPPPPCAVLLVDDLPIDNGDCHEETVR